LVGPSRKRFIGELLGGRELAELDTGTAVVVMHCALAGVEMVRVHNVGLVRRIVDGCAQK
jgi:dihydropteroate synthase